MDPRFSTTQWGWRRFLLHFGGAWGVSSLVLYLLFLAGVPYSLRGLTLAWLVTVGVLATMEIGQTRQGQAAGKAVIDLASKAGGLAISIFTSGLWWVR